MHGQLTGQILAGARRFDGIKVAHQISHRHIGCRQLLDVAVLAGQKGDRRFRTLGCDQIAAAPAQRVVGVVTDLAAGDIRHLLVEQLRQPAQDAALGLSAQAEQNEVLFGQNCIHDLRNNRILKAHDAGEDLLCASSLARAIRFSRSSSFTVRFFRRASVEFFAGLQLTQSLGKTVHDEATRVYSSTAINESISERAYMTCPFLPAIALACTPRRNLGNIAV